MRFIFPMFKCSFSTKAFSSYPPWEERKIELVFIVRTSNLQCNFLWLKQLFSVKLVVTVSGDMAGWFGIVTWIFMFQLSHFKISTRFSNVERFAGFAYAKV